MAKEAVGSGKVVAPGAGAVIAQILAAAGPPAVLPAGQYDVRVIASVSNAAAADEGNMKLATTGGVVADLVNPLPHGVNGVEAEFTLHNVVLDGASNLLVTAVGAGTAAIIYEATIAATRVADRP